MSETYPRKNLFETLFAGHISLQRRFGCKGSDLFWIVQENPQKIRILIRSFLAYLKKIV